MGNTQKNLLYAFCICICLYSSRSYADFNGQHPIHCTAVWKSVNTSHHIPFKHEAQTDNGIVNFSKVLSGFNPLNLRKYIQQLAPKFVRVRFDSSYTQERETVDKGDLLFISPQSDFAIDLSIDRAWPTIKANDKDPMSIKIGLEATLTTIDNRVAKQAAQFDSSKPNFENLSYLIGAMEVKLVNPIFLEKLNLNLEDYKEVSSDVRHFSRLIHNSVQNRAISSNELIEAKAWCLPNFKVNPLGN